MKLILFATFIFSTIFSFLNIDYNSTANKFLKNDRYPAQVADSQSYGWKLSFEDNFSDPEVAIFQEGVPFECYYEDLTMKISSAATCMLNYWSQKKCSEDYTNNLKNLNKCNWSVYDYYNYMDFNYPDGKGLNAFKPSMVEVKNGNLYLHAKRSNVEVGKINCKKKYYDERIQYENYTTDCAIYSGAVESKKLSPGVSIEKSPFRGFDQAYGRFEVRVKLPGGDGIWPAVWYLPNYPVEGKLEYDDGSSMCGWPYSGEIDLIETWADNPSDIHSGFIHGRCDEKLDVRKGFSNKIKTATTNFHTYAIEWSPNYIKYIHDNKVIGVIYKDEDLEASSTENKNAKKTKRQAWIPSYPFYWILNFSVVDSDKGKVNINNFPDQEMVIDYVKTYMRCTNQDDPVKCKKFHDIGVVEEYNNNSADTTDVDFAVYPSPVSNKDGKVSLSMTAHDSCENVTMQISNLKGQVLEKKDLPSGFLEKEITKYYSVDIHDYPSGLFIATLNFWNCGEFKNLRGKQSFKFVVTQ